MTAVLFLDGAGAPFDGDTPKTTGLGGSEMAQIQLAEALAARGARVKVLVMRDTCYEPRTINGVTYGHSDLSDVTTIIASRMTPVPAELAAGKRVIVSLTDMGPHKIATCDFLVGVSRWQINRFDTKAKKRVIPCIVEHENVDENQKIPGRFVYASARMKGLDATLAAWKNLRQFLPENAHLRVTTAGWDLPAEGSVEEAGAEWLGILTPEQIRQEIATARGLFYINTYPETFCAIAAIAEASRTRPCIFCPPLDGMSDPYTGKPWAGPQPGALPEVLNTPIYTSGPDFARGVLDVANGRANLFSAKNYSPNKVCQAWENLII
jgi:hypothetical protein